MDEHGRAMAMQQMRTHLARADSEQEAALKFLDPRTDDEAEIDLVRAIANAKACIGDAPETIRASLREPAEYERPGVGDAVRLTSRPGGAGSAGSDIRCLLLGGATVALGGEISSLVVFNAAVERVCKRADT